MDRVRKGGLNSIRFKRQSMKVGLHCSDGNFESYTCIESIASCKSR